MSFQSVGELFGDLRLARNLDAGYRVVTTKLNKVFIHNIHDIDHTRVLVMVCHSISVPPFLIVYHFFLLSNISYRFLPFFKLAPI